MKAHHYNLPPVDADTLDWIADTILRDLAERRTSPAAALFLLRRYVDSGRTDLRDASEIALTEGLALCATLRDPVERTDWLGVFADATAISEDERLPETVQQRLADTVDGLEQFVRAAYEPGEGLVGATLIDHLRCSVALLTAFELTGRLPYSMLAEELVRAARRRWWSDAGLFADAVIANCVDAQIACRLAALYRDPDYAESSVIAPDANYEADAHRTLIGLIEIVRDHPEAAAAYGVALVHWSALNSQTNPG
jgi:uncharacterized protein YyaL (SSP411 family)